MRPSPPLLILAALIALSTLPPAAFAQTGVLRGVVLNARDNAPVAFARVQIPSLQRGVLTGEDGRFEFAGLPAGSYSVTVQQLGFRSVTRTEIEVSPVRPAVVEVRLEEQVVLRDSVEVVASPFRRSPESPVSVQSLGAAEIERLPGGNRDLSRVVQSLPGVASSPSFRNDVFVRGGAPSENRFDLDGVRVPNINHFATQGSTGGPVGMIDVNLIQEVELLTSAFPAARGDALSSVMRFRMREANDERLTTRLTLGASDLGLTVDGPLGANADLIVSARRSYLQFLFKALGLPFLPTYNDLQFKSRIRVGPKDDVQLIGLGAIDQLELNESAGEGDAFDRYLLDNLPITPQWNYAAGGVWRHFGPGGVRTLVLSRSQLDNRAEKFLRNDASDPANRVLDYHSTESEDDLRLEWSRASGPWRWQYGAGATRARYSTDTFQRRATPAGVVQVDYDSALDLFKGSAFAQVSRGVLEDRLSASLGLRLDASDYSRETRSPMEQFSPRLALSYAVTPSLSASASVARYFALPAYTVLGYRDSTGRLANRDAGVRAIRSDHAVAGLEYRTRIDSRFTLEGFYKRYADYPFLTREGVSLANLGADFGVIGDAPAVSGSRGRAYGAELLAQQRLYRGWYGIAAYTFVRSEFTTASGAFAPSAWDNRHIASLTGGRRWASGWEAGVRLRALGGAPYTPDDLALSSLREVWDAAGRAQPDYSRLNSQRNGTFTQLDVRVDKRWLFGTRALEVYLDVQNLTAATVRTGPVVTVQRDADGRPLVDPADPGRYLLETLPAQTGTALPTIGLRFTF